MHRKTHHSRNIITTPNTNNDEEENRNIEYEYEPLLQEGSIQPCTSYQSVNS
jgi:hypothetical protein